MTSRLAVGLASLLLLLFPRQSWGQGTDVSFGGSALISVQPVEDDRAGGGPYLSGPGMGGIGPGVSAAVNVTTERGLTVTVEFTTAWFEAERTGRVVPGPCPPNTPPNECSFVGSSGMAHLNDSMLGGLVGRAMRSGNTQAHFLGGAYWRLDELSIEDVPLSETGLVRDRAFVGIAIGGGLDVVHRLGSDTSLVVGARYIYIADHDRRHYSGASPHVIRAGIGLRFRLN
jgi:hypothetical protein